MLSFKVDGTGTAAIKIGALDAALTDNGTGDYTLTFAKPFARECMAVATAMTADAYCEIKAQSATAINVLVKKPSDMTAKDGIFNVMVMGFDGADQY